MTSFPRRLGAGLFTTLLVTGGLATTAAPASATVTTLCVGYTGCAKLGMSDAGYAKASGTMYWRMYSGHNCTNYAAYRMVKSGLANSRPWTGGGNATRWGTSMASKTNGTPTVGSVAWWKAGVYPAGSAGHVAYVEKVVSADEIIVSMDSWRGDFSWARITRASRGWPSGFVHFNDVKLANKSLPAVTGSPKVGTRLTASPGAWSVSGATYSYQWLANGAPVSGATSSTLTPTQALKGKQLSVKVTVAMRGYATTYAISAATAAVAPGVLSSTAPPTVSGEPQVDQTLSAQPGSWDPGSPQVSYQWLADGVAVPGATSSTLALAPPLAGKKMSVQVTASKTGYTAVRARSATTQPVALGVMAPTAPPNLTGQTSRGSTLQVGASAVPAGATSSIRWMRGKTRIPGAKGSTYRLTNADLGHRMRAVVLVNRPGYRQLVLRTSWTPFVRTTPTVRMSTIPGPQRLNLRVTLRAAGLSGANARVQVRTGGELVRVVPIRGGAASATLTGLRPGTRIYKFRIPATDSTNPVVITRRLTIR